MMMPSRHRPNSGAQGIRRNRSHSLPGTTSLKPIVPAPRKHFNGPAPGWMAVARGAALGLACLLALNLLEIFVHGTSAVENWFCSLKPLTQPLCIAILAMAATSFVMFSMRPGLPGPVWFATFGLVLMFSGFCGWELLRINQQVPDAMRVTAMARPLGILMLLAVAGIGVLTGNADSVRGRSSFFAIVTSAAIAISAFAVVTIQTGGLSDTVSEMPVSAILVLGCGLNADGTPSEALTDRVISGCKLLQATHSTLLVLSGRPGINGVSEPAVMQQLSIASGVTESSLLLHESGTDLAASIRFVAGLPELKDDRRVIVVSHWHQLARARLLARRTGVTVVAVAAEQQHALFNQNLLVAKEVGSLLKAFCDPGVEFVRSSTNSVDGNQK